MINLNELNPAQRDAVLYTDGPSLVIAGAGSGKTRVLTYKIAYLLSQGMPSWNILALTFTNKAAEEMRSRIIRQVGADAARGLWMGTFHSIFSRILRAEHEAIGFTSDFTIYDAADSKSLIKSVISPFVDEEINPILKSINGLSISDKEKKELITREREKVIKRYSPNRILAKISRLKNQLIIPQAYSSNKTNLQEDDKDGIKFFSEIYARYWARCRQAGAMDFDDLLLYTYLLFAHKPEILQRYEERFHFVLVDEYQDTNYAQHAIVWQLTQHKRRVCVVGDDAQSIYSFRGANIDNILTFQRLYEGARLFKLEQNYRSTQTIVGAANSLIKHNRGQIPKEVFSEKTQGQPIHVYSYYSDIEEASGVAKKVQNLNRYEHIEWNDIAILYRTNAQSRTFEEAFRKAGIPYRIFGGLSFYQRKEIKDLIAYFRLTVNPNDEEALKRVINYPARGIGDTTISKVVTKASEQGVSLWQVISQPEQYGLDVNRGTMTKLSSFVQLIESFRQDVDTLDAATLGLRITRESGVQADIFRGREPDDISRQENLQELLDGMQQFVDDRMEEEGRERVLMTHYLQEVSLVSDLDESDDDSEAKVSLMTIHAAKGLEFRVVFVVGMEENLFPNAMSSSSPRELEEERRLFYVAITRAEEQCFLTHAQNRYRYGKSEFCTPSTFLSDIDERFLEQDESQAIGSRRRSFSSFGRTDDALFQRPRAPWDDAPRFSSSSPSRGSDDASRFSPAGRGSSSDSSRLSSTPPAGMRRVGVRTESDASSSPVTSTQTTAGTLTVGQHIEHARFGRGEVIALSGSGIDAKATVRFDNVGTKQLLLRFAKFTVL